MSKEYLTENISDETLVKLIDKTIKFENTQKNNSIKINLLKMIPAAAAVVFIIGLVNILPHFINFDAGPSDIGTSMNITTPANTDNMPDEPQSVVPMKISKSSFEEDILAFITDEKDLRTVKFYYTLKDASDPNLTEYDKEMLLKAYPMCETTPFYLFDINASDREIDKVAEIIRKYTDYFYEDNDNDEFTSQADDPYAHVRFGETRDILLLDIEWHTYDTYLEEVVKPYKKYREEIKEIQKSDEYLRLYDEDKMKNDTLWKNTDEKTLKFHEETLNNIKEQKTYHARTINGNPGNIILESEEPIDISQYLDPDGYYIWQVYPGGSVIVYYDENGELQTEFFKVVFSKSEYDDIFESKMKPFYEELLEKGLTPLDSYDFYKKDPLQRDVERYFPIK